MNPVIDRARAYVAAMPAAISGQDGHKATFSVAVSLRHGFALSENEAWELLLEYNSRCSPPWNFPELRHKLASAGKLDRHPKAKGHLIGGGQVKTRRRGGPPPATHVHALFTPPKIVESKSPRIFGMVRLSARYAQLLPPEIKSKAQKIEENPVVRHDPTTTPVGWCPVCWKHWGRALRPGCCICTGHVRIGSRGMTGGYRYFRRGHPCGGGN